MMRKIAFWLTLALIFTIPWEDSLTVAVGTGSSFTRLFGMGVAGVWALTILMQGRFNRPHLFHAFTILFFLWNILSYWWTLDALWSYQNVKTYAQIFILMLIVWEMLQEPDELKAGLQAYLLGAFVLIGSTLLNYVRGAEAVSYEVRFSATGVNANDLAIFLLMGLPMAWHLFRQPYKNLQILKFVNLAYIPLAVFAVLLTASRTSLFAVIPAAIFIVWPKRLDAGRIILSVFIVLVSIILLQTLLPTAIIERLSSVTTSISNADLGGRVILWQDSINIFEQHPIIGVGSGAMTSLIGGFSHQTFLSVLAETGLIGFFLFTAVLIFLLMEIFRLPKGYLGLWLATFFVWFIGVLSVSFEFRKITWLFFTFMIIQGNSLRNQWRSKKADIRLSEAEDVSGLGSIPDSLAFRSRQKEERDSA